MTRFTRVAAHSHANPLANNSKAGALAHFLRFCANAPLKLLKSLRNTGALAQCAITPGKANDFNNYPRLRAHAHAISSGNYVPYGDRSFIPARSRSPTPWGLRGRALRHGLDKKKNDQLLAERFHRLAQLLETGLVLGVQGPAAVQNGSVHE